MNSTSSMESDDIGRRKVTVLAPPLSSHLSPPPTENYPYSLPSSLDAQRLDRRILEMKGCSRLSQEQLEHYDKAFHVMPKEGDDFLGFRLISEIGRGSFGRVFLASQFELANRLVALKISPDVGVEANRLARLQHTNIVPVHSVYLKGSLQALCMPYLGSNTLDNLIIELRWLRDGTKENLPLIREYFTSRGLDEIDGILTVAAKLAEGLAHAHKRKILHCDLKPANVLLSDDGEPMLLDFNLSVNALHVTNTAFVGTFPYMSPEQLLRYFDEGPGVDERSDLYSLGVILFEMLTGVDRFENPIADTIDEQVKRMIADRSTPTPRLRDWNPKVPPSVQSIIERLLAPSAADRYRSANELREDLQRQLRRRRLKYAPDRSWREAWSRFRRRNPQLTSVVSLSLMTVALVAILWTGLVASQNALVRADAREVARNFQDQRRELAFLLTGLTASDRAERGIRRSEEALSHFRPELIELIPEADRPVAREGIAEVLYLQAVGHKLRARRVAPKLREAELEKAEASLGQLGAMDEGGKLRRAVAALRADLERIRGNEKEARRLEALAKEGEPQSGLDLYLTAVAAFERKDDPEAIELLERSLRDDPTNLHAWSMLGACRARGGELHDAAAIFSTCISLRPNFPDLYYLRGVNHLQIGSYEEATLDMTETIRRDPEFADAYLNRALALVPRRDREGARRDLDRVIELQPSHGRAYLIRSGVRLQLKDGVGAESDRKKGLELTPVEPTDWVVRARARLPDDPEGALADCDEALRIEPHFLPALQNKAAIFVEFFKKTEDAIRILDQAIDLFPNSWPAHSGRGILLARRGEREEAIRAAEIAASLDNSPKNRYQLAGIYAQTSRQVPEDALEAFMHLGAALRGGFGFEHLDGDTDLDPIRRHPRFERTVREARERSSKERKP